MPPGNAFQRDGATYLKARWPYRFVLESLNQEHHGEISKPIGEIWEKSYESIHWIITLKRGLSAGLPKKKKEENAQAVKADPPPHTHTHTHTPKNPKSPLSLESRESLTMNDMRFDNILFSHFIGMSSASNRSFDVSDFCPLVSDSHGSKSCL